MIGEIATKEELLTLREEIGRKLSELETQLTSINEEVDFLIKQPTNQIIRIKKPTDLNELKIPNNFKVISIPEIKEGINTLLREYGLIKTDVNHTYSARSSFNLSAEEEESRNQKKGSDQLQTSSNKVNNNLNEFMKKINDIPLRDEYGRIIEDGGMYQIDPPSLELDAGPADMSIDSVVDDLEGIVVLC